jgi:membrane-bound lytic murein transglycosylase D
MADTTDMEKRMLAASLVLAASVCLPLTVLAEGPAAEGQEAQATRLVGDGQPEAAILTSGAAALPDSSSQDTAPAGLLTLSEDLTVKPLRDAAQEASAGTLAAGEPELVIVPSQGIPKVELRPEEAIASIDIIRNAKVEGHMRFFHTAIRDRFEQWLTRLSRYKPLVDRIFSEFDLPSDLVFLSLVESGFNPHAYSRARATGPWQFMKGTAQVYGLRVDQYVDERRDPIKSTVAAARYLRDLYDLFGTWPLAMAAYNAGEGKVLRALQKTQADNFWDIAATKHLRRETKEYVPRFMAATIIARNPDQFGFPAADTDPHEFDEVIVRRAVHFRDLERTTGIPYSEWQRLNPELRRDVTPPDDDLYLLKVPVGDKEKVEQALEQIPAWKPPARLPKLASTKLVKRKGDASESKGWYRVRVGDSLWTIAKRFNLSVADLKARNNLSSRRLKPGELLAISR